MTECLRITISGLAGKHTEQQQIRNIGEMTGKKVEVGRPRKEVDFAIVLRMREERKLGWSRMAQAYRELTGQYISRDTIKRRYFEARAKKANSR